VSNSLQQELASEAVEKQEKTILIRAIGEIRGELFPED
jgi:hypothetical protein